eukprot:Em0001g1040a
MRHVMEVLKKLRLHDYIAKKQATFMSQYKNCYNFTNLCYHEDDFGVATEWHFFATSHGKSAAGGIGGTVKRTSAKASLQRPKEDQILTPAQLYHFVSSEIKGGVLTAKQAAPEQSHHRSRKAKSKKRLHRRSSSSESIDTSSSSSSSLSSESSDSDAHRKKRKFKRHKRHSKLRNSSFLNLHHHGSFPFEARKDPSSLPGGKQKKSKYMRQIRTSTGASIHLGTTTGSSHHSEHATHTPSGEEICRRFKFEKCSKGTECAFSNKCWVTDFVQHPEIVDAELEKEGCFLGPFSQRPLKHFRTSGLGTVPKKNGKWRVIHHLSAPEGLTINDFISKEDFAIHYSTIDDAVVLLSRFDKGAMMAKVCERMGVPVATEKCEGPATCITFLGIVLDSSLQQLRLPADKLQEISSHGLAYTKSQEGAPIAHWEACVCSQARRLHHYIHLNSEARADIRWWNSFLPSWNGISMFISPEWNDAESIQLFTDALAPLDFVHTSMGPGSEVTGNHTSNYPSAPYYGRSSLPLWQQLSLGVTSWKGNASDFTAIICP